RLVTLAAANTPGGPRALARSLPEYSPAQPVTFVLGISADKDQAGILEALAPLATRVILTAYSSARAASPAALASRMPGGAVRPEMAASPAEALSLALRPARTPIVCVAGSLYLIGEILGQTAEKQDFFVAFGPADSMKAHASAPDQSRS